jgi:hypothetical protein
MNNNEKDERFISFKEKLLSDVTDIQVVALYLERRLHRAETLEQLHSIRDSFNDLLREHC